MFWWDEHLRSPQLHTPPLRSVNIGSLLKEGPTKSGLAAQRRHTPVAGACFLYLMASLFGGPSICAVLECSSLYVAKRALALFLTAYSLGTTLSNSDQSNVLLRTFLRFLLSFNLCPDLCGNR